MFWLLRAMIHFSCSLNVEWRAAPVPSVLSQVISITQSECQAAALTYLNKCNLIGWTFLCTLPQLSQAKQTSSSTIQKRSETWKTYVWVSVRASIRLILTGSGPRRPTSITTSTFVHNAFLMQLWAAGPISFPHCKVKNICSSILVPCLVCTVLDTVRIITKHDFGLITVRWMWTPDTWANTNSPAFHYSPRTAQAISLWAYRGVWRAQIY